MKLPGLPFLEKKPQTEYFIALLLRDEKVNALIVEQANGAITIVGKHEEYFTSPLEELSLEELVKTIDTTISRAEESLPADIEVQNTVFGVKDTWVEDKKIQKDYLKKLKEICNQLSLTPMGFIVIQEALAHLIQKEEGAPVSALITEIGKQSITVSLFRAGKLVESKHQMLEESPMKTVDTMLKTFQLVEILPSRIILFNTVVSEDEAATRNAIAQKFIAHPWSKSLPFLHVPQVSILPGGFDGKAIVFGAATQLGLEFTGIPQDAKEAGIKTYQKHHIVSTEHVVARETKEEETLMASDNLVSEPEIEEATVTPEGVTADNFGFVVDQDIATLPASQKIHHPKHGDKGEAVVEKTTSSEEVPYNEPYEEATEEFEESRTKTASPLIAIMTNILAPLKRLSFSRSRPSLPGGKLLIIIPLLLLISIGVVVLYITKLQATVTLTVTPKLVDETQKVTFSTSSENDFSANVIAANEVTTAIEGTAAKAATGQKEVGDKAKGTVTIYNKSFKKITINAGTSITSNNGLVYLLDKEVSVASASGDLSGTKSGTAQASVTAKNIGPDYNLPSNAIFSVEGNSDLAGKNDNAFSGGTKRKVTVVSQKDIDALLAQLPKELTEKAKESIQSKLSPDEILLPEFSNTSFEKRSFDKNVDSEAKEVKVTATVIFDGITYQKKDIMQFAQATLKEKFAHDQTIPENSISTNVSGIKMDDDGDVAAILAIKAGLLPKIDNAKIAKEITGKSYDDVSAYIKRLPQVEKVSIALRPNVSFLFKVLPRLTENITIIVEPKD